MDMNPIKNTCRFWQCYDEPTRNHILYSDTRGGMQSIYLYVIPLFGFFFLHYFHRIDLYRFSMITNNNNNIDAVILEGLLRSSSESTIIEPLVNHLLAERVNGRWRNTQENCWAAVAFYAYFKSKKSNLLSPLHIKHCKYPNLMFYICIVYLQPTRKKHPISLLQFGSAMNSVER